MTKKDTELQTKLQELATRNKVSLEEVTDKFSKFLAEKKDEKQALYATMNDYRRVKQFQTFTSNRPQKEIATLYGFIVGTRGIWDKAETIRRKAKSFINKNGIVAAKEQGLIDGDNHILDTRDKIYGRENPNYGKPLPEGLHILDLMLYGYFRHNGDKTYKIGTIQTSNNGLARGWDKSIIQENRTFTPAQVNAIIDYEDKTDITLRATTAKGSESVFKAVNEKLDIKSIIDKSTKFSEIKSLEKEYEMSKDAWDRKTIIKGIVTWMNTDRPDALGRVTIGVMNPDNEEELVRVRVDPSITSLDFGELSEIYVFGKLNRSMYKDRESQELVQGDVVLDAFGIYVVSATPKTSGVDETPDEDVINGWLE